MKKNVKRVSVALFAVICLATLTGCTNWEQECKKMEILYENCQGNLENCEGRLASMASETRSLGERVKQSQKIIDDLNRQLKAGVSESKASGFEGMNVKYDKAKGTITVTLQNTVLFSSGKASLKTATVKELDRIRNVLQERYRGLQIDVVGHTDTDPIKKSGWKDNWELSAERALSVLRYLSSRGISSNQIRAVAEGSSRPVASNRTSAGKSQNRRVEIVVHTR